MLVFVNRFCHPDHSATSQILSDLAAHLVTRGNDVRVFAARMRYDQPDVALPARESWQGVDIRRVWTTRFGRGHLVGRAIDYLSFYASVSWALLLALRRGDIVVAKTDPPLLGLVVAVVASLRGATLVNWLQDVFPEVAVALGQPRVPAPAAHVMRKLRNFTLGQAAANVVIGHRMGELLAREGADPARTMVIPNWAHEDAIRPMPSEASQARIRLGLAGKFVVGYSGNLGRAHDFETLLDAARRLAADPAVAFLVTGGGHGYEQLRLQSADLHNMHFLPYQPIELLSDAMAAADLHLVTLRPELEGMIVPSKFYGIAAAERPVAFVGDGDGELARLVADGGCGFTVAPGDGASLAAGIVRLAGDPQACRAQGVRARLLLERRFSRLRAQDLWSGLFQSLSSRNH